MNYYTIYKRSSAVCVALAIVILLSSLVGSQAQAQSYTPITGEAGTGSTGTNVSALQTFLASNPKIYPQALVTGYFGSLTEAAVRNFQVGYALPVVGRVGPLTLAKIATLFASGRPIDVSSPLVTNTSITNIGTSRATISWNTDEVAIGKLHFNTSPITGIEALQSKMEPTLSGQVSTSGTLGNTSHTVSLTGLNGNTTYYYAIVATDVQGNVTVQDWNKTFRTD